jgi:hypothetical protein
METEEAQAAQFLADTIMSSWLRPSLWVAVQLKLADRLAHGRRTADDLAAETATDPTALFRLLNALSSVGVVKRVADRAYEGTAVSKLLCSDDPSGLADLADTALGGENYAAWGSLMEAVRVGGCAFEIQHGAHWTEYLRERPDRHAVFAAAMTATTRVTEQALLESHDFGQFELAVDVGGSHASLIGALLDRHPSARGVVFDLPETIETSRVAWADAPFAPRLQGVGGDFFKAVPEGDLYLLKQILHDWMDPEAVAILKTIRRAIRPSGRIAVIEQMLPSDGSPHAGWGADLVMMAITGGRERTCSDYERMFAEAGFAPIGYTATPSRFSVLEGRAV